MNISKKIVLVLLLDALLFIFCCIGITNLLNKATPPFKVISSSDGLLIYDHDIPDGSTMISLEGIPVTSLDELEFVTDGLSIGDLVTIDYTFNESFDSVTVELISYYGSFYLYSVFVTGLTFFILGIFVLLKLNANRVSTIFHLACISIASIMMMSSGKFTDTLFYSGYLSRILFHTAYLITPTLFLHFALLFPVDRVSNNRTFLWVLYSVSLILLIAVNASFIAGALKLNGNTVATYAQIFHVLRIFIIAIVLISISIFFNNLMNQKGETERKKLKWIITGFLLGPLSFLLLWVIPILFGFNPVVREEIIVLSNNAIPVTFTIAIIRYHLLDIDYIINRAIVYGIVISLLIGSYIIIILLLVDVLHTSESKYITVLSALFVAFLFLPIKQRVQIFVDKKFFRVKYNFRVEVNTIHSAIKEFSDVNSLNSYLIKKVDSLIPVEKMYFVEVDEHKRLLKITHSKSFDDLINKEIKLNYSKFKLFCSAVFTRSDKVEKEALDSTIFDKFLHRYNLALVIPLISEREICFGILCLGEKISRLRYTIEDIDLLKSIASTAASTINRINLQEQLIAERVTSEKLKELNEKKSLYVSSVSHDLKTPLTSIKMFAELLLKNNEIINEKVKNHLNIIDSETDRLTRLISNVLDVSKIEKGMQEYHFKNCNLNRVVEEILSVVEGQIYEEGFSLIKNYEKYSAQILADEDAVKQALENLISNAMKYSKDKKTIYIQTYCENNYVNVKVEDEGIGFSTASINEVFNLYYRDKKDKPGLGLGLYIVKHIIDAHKGIIEIKNNVNGGASVILKFPKIEIKH